MAWQEAHITGSVLTWALEESGFSRGEVADKLRVAVSDIKSWETETTRPSKGNLTNLAKTLHRPSAVFYLPEPPKHQSLPSSFRKAPGPSKYALDSKELLKIREARRLQDMLSWIREDASGPPIDLPNFAIDKDAEKAAQEFRDTVGVPLEYQMRWTDHNEAFSEWRSALEHQGVIVLQQSLGKEKIRGFNIWDDFAPLVAVNTGYHKTAGIYTLFHQVGHLLVRENAACLEFVPPTTDKIAQNFQVERWVEHFSAAFLMPKAEFAEVAASLIPAQSKIISDIKDVKKIAALFKVSTRAASFRLQELGMTSKSFYTQVSKELDKLDLPPQGGSGQTDPRKRLDEVGLLTVDLIFGARARQRLNDLDVADYLDLTTDQVDDLRNIILNPPEFC